MPLAAIGAPGLPELLIILVIVLVVLGPKRLPGLGRQLGGGMRGFKDAITGDKDKKQRDASGLPPHDAGDAHEETVTAEPVDERRRDPRA
ncbi:twin-arginine translocase TatA/TatE family subunit [Patulibacter sp. SYSU D01012]|uniref:Sec-independent protein translocase subunit TatA/TatB n=1 Tax=Patulibacter sp. SYSU D01012 TaxID=2817381 RepID=UPI001B315950|nr:twin-arginine translocase TatA/TatE family subunit [Patulibacter sp. SYSU D01012]